MLPFVCAKHVLLFFNEDKSTTSKNKGGAAVQRMKKSKKKGGRKRKLENTASRLRPSSQESEKTEEGTGEESLSGEDLISNDIPDGQKIIRKKKDCGRRSRSSDQNIAKESWIKMFQGGERREREGREIVLMKKKHSLERKKKATKLA
jgi:hypothetical protein